MKDHHPFGRLEADKLEQVMEIVRQILRFVP